MNILVINCGSSSVKFHLFSMPDEIILIHGKMERNSTGDTDFKYQVKGNMVYRSWDGFTYSRCMKSIIDTLTDPVNRCLSSPGEIDIVGHRLIHGGEEGSSCKVITEEFLSYMESCIPLAPLHYPANLEGIKTLRKLLPAVMQAGVFDTAFHQTMPPKAYLYGIPLDLYKNYGIRRYGFHGSSHKYVTQRACMMTGLNYYKSKIVSCHLGNGASLAAVKNGRSLDTSMGLTPVEGVMMGTRSGDIDAGILVYLQNNFNFSTDDIQDLINRKGGLLGLSGISPDYRIVAEAALNGSANARIALEVYHYRVKKYIGAYTAAMGGADILIFTGGIGENSIFAREEICKKLDCLGIKLSKKLNREFNGREGFINKTESKAKIVIIPAREELMIARECMAILQM